MTPGQPMPQGNAPSQSSPEQVAIQAIDSIKQGFATLGKVLQGAGQSLPPEDIKLYQSALQATDALVQSLTGPGDNDGDEAPRQPSQPMAANANANARPMSPATR